MCGIFALIASTHDHHAAKNAVSLATELLIQSEIRGREASGITFVVNNKATVLKGSCTARELVKTPEYRAISREVVISADSHLSEDITYPILVIGHARMATNGDAERYANNQPILTNSVIGVHNGIAVNHEDLWRRNPELTRDAQVDSEVIFSLLDCSLMTQNAGLKHLSNVLMDIDGQCSVLAFHKEYQALLYATNNGSLYMMSGANDIPLVLGSEKRIIKRALTRFKKGLCDRVAIKKIQPNTVGYVNLETQTVESTSTDSAECVAPLLPRSEKPLFSSVSKVKTQAVSQAKKSPQVLGSVTRAMRNIEKMYEEDLSWSRQLSRCSKCLLPETMPFIQFDRLGVCNYCRSYVPLEYLGEQALIQASLFRGNAGRRQPLVGLSGGRDSSYAIHYLKKELNWDPVAFTYDWGLVTDLARRNIARMCGRLGIEHVLVCADIIKKREHVRKNVLAWLDQPDLGMIPLFMAGDKEYFSQAQKIVEEMGLDTIIFGDNLLETTDFKKGFAGVAPRAWEDGRANKLHFAEKLQLLYFYSSRFSKNKKYWNSSIPETVKAFSAYYQRKLEYINLYSFIEWNEAEIESTLTSEYDWEVASDTTSLWRIGDGTAPFYNLIYFHVSGFTENDAFRSNQIRQGVMTRRDAHDLVEADNAPRFEGLLWYCQVIGLDFPDTIEAIKKIPRSRRKVV